MPHLSIFEPPNTFGYFTPMDHKISSSNIKHHIQLSYWCKSIKTSRTSQNGITWWNKIAPMPWEHFQADSTKYKIYRRNFLLPTPWPPSIKATKWSLIRKLNALGRWSKTFIDRICCQKWYKLSFIVNSSIRICIAKIKCREIYKFTN